MTMSLSIFKQRLKTLLFEFSLNCTKQIYFFILQSFSEFLKIYFYCNLLVLTCNDKDDDDVTRQRFLRKCLRFRSASRRFWRSWRRRDLTRCPRCWSQKLLTAGRRWRIITRLIRQHPVCRCQLLPVSRTMYADLWLYQIMVTLVVWKEKVCLLLLLCLSSSSSVIVIRFQAGGRRKQLNLGLVCFVCVICIS